MRISKIMVVLAVLATVCAPGVDAETLHKVKCSEAVRGFFCLPLYVAHGLKFFENQGLQVEIITAKAGPLAMQALIAGEVQFCATGHGLVANMLIKGKSTKIVHQMLNKCTFYLISRPEITEIAQLKGHNVGCTKVGAESYAVARYLVAKAGLDPKKDVTMVGVGGMGPMASSLENDRIKATLAWQPLVTRLLKEKKANVLARLNTPSDCQKHFGSPYYSFSVVQVTDEFVAKNPEIVQKFVNALVRAEKWIQIRKVDEMVEVAQPYFMNMDKEILKASITEDLQAYSRTGIVAKASHDTVMRVWIDAGIFEKPVPFEAIVNNSFSEKAQ